MSRVGLLSSVNPFCYTENYTDSHQWTNLVPHPCNFTLHTVDSASNEKNLMKNVIKKYMRLWAESGYKLSTIVFWYPAAMV